MKALINSHEDVVIESLDGLVASVPHLARLDGFPEIKVVYDLEHDGDTTVSLVSGGGSGHEPAFAGFVGAGMLAAAVAGNVFAAPPEESILAAIRQVTGKAGALLLIINYTGDRLNFGAAAERAKAEGYAVEMIICGEDCGLQGKNAAGRRGLAGSALAVKIAGAAAAAGMPLAQVKALAEQVVGAMGTVGCSLTTCTLPGQEPSARLGPEEMELGLGIHGEPGAHRSKVKPADALVAELVDRITGHAARAAGAAPGQTPYLPVSKGDRVALLVNNLGGATQLEMGILARAAIKETTEVLGAKLEWVLGGTLVSSLDMRGLSVTLLLLGEGANGDTLIELLSAPTKAAGWPRFGGAYDHTKAPTPLPPGPDESDSAGQVQGGAGDEFTPDARALEGPGEGAMHRCIAAACNALLEAEDELNELDRAVGDGDCGSTVAKGAAAVLGEVDGLPLRDAAGTALALAKILGRSMGGTSGGVNKIFWTAAGARLKAAAGNGAGPQQLTVALGEWFVSFNNKTMRYLHHFTAEYFQCQCSG